MNQKSINTWCLEATRILVSKRSTAQDVQSWSYETWINFLPPSQTYLTFSSSGWYMFMVPQPHHPSPSQVCTPSPTWYRHHRADRKYRELLKSKNEVFWEWGKGASVFIKNSSLNQLCQGKPARRWEHMAGRQGGRDMAVLTQISSRCHGIALSLAIFWAQNKFVPVHI